MPPKHRQKSSSEATRFEGIDNELLKLTFIETLSDSDVIKQLKRALFPQEIADKIDYLAAQTEKLKQTVKEKDEKIKALESRVDLLELAKDSIEQYHRRSNLRIEGIPESVGILQCGLTTLESRRLRGDQIEVFKIVNGYEDVDRNMFFILKEGSRT